MQLFHHPMNAPCRFIRLVMAEYGAEPDLIVEHVWQRRPEFLAIEPGGSLPVLLSESGAAVVGTHAISEYLDETRGVMMRERRLMPDTPLERAEVRRLKDWFLDRLERDVTRILVMERVIKLEKPADGGGSAPNSAAMRAARANIRSHLRYLNWLAGSRNWLAGKNFTMADLAAGAAVSVLDYMGEITWTDAPQARDWYARVKSRPSFRPLLADRVRGLSPVSHYADLDF